MMLSYKIKSRRRTALQKEIRYVKNHPITNENKKYKRIVEFPEKNWKINKQIQIESHIFCNDKNYYNNSDLLLLIIFLNSII